MTEMAMVEKLNSTSEELIRLATLAVAGDASALAKYHALKWEGETFQCKFCGCEQEWPGMCKACEKRADADELTPEGKLVNMGVPSSMVTCGWDNFEMPKPGTMDGRLVEEVKRWRGAPPGLILAGPNGTGKTHMAVAIIRQRIGEKGVGGVLWLSDPEVGARLKAGFKDEGVSVEDQLRNVRTLVIDDFGQSYQTAWVQETVVPILCWRLDNSKPTILTTNLTGADFESLDGRLASRLQQSLMVSTRNLVDKRST